MTIPRPLTSLPGDARLPALSSVTTQISDRLSGLLRHHQPADQAATVSVTAVAKDLVSLLELVRLAQEELQAQGDDLTVTLNIMEHARRRYHDLFDRAPDPYVVTDPDGRILEANAAAVRLIGYSRAHAYGRSLLSFLTSDSASALAPRIQALDGATSEDLAELHMQIRARGRGSYRAVHARVRRLAEHPGARSQLLWLLRRSPENDPHRRTPSTNGQSPAHETGDLRLRAVLRASPDAVFLLDAGRRVQFCNPAALRLIGSADGRRLDEVLRSAVHPDDQARVRRSLLRRRSAAGWRDAIRFRIQTGDGAWQDAEASIALLPRDFGARGALLTVRDISGHADTTQALDTYRAHHALATKLGALHPDRLDEPSILQRIAPLPLPEIADSCRIYLLDPDGTARQVASAHHGREYDAAPRGPASHEPVALGGGSLLIAQWIRAGEPLLMPDPPGYTRLPVVGDTPARGDQSRTTPTTLLLPLAADIGPIGALILSCAASGRRYSDLDLRLGEDFAHRVSLLIICARLARRVGSSAIETDRRQPDTEGAAPRVSRREREVLALLEHGLTNREIAAYLYLSERTVEHHISRMLARFRLSTRTHLAAHALRHGLIEGIPSADA